MDLIKSISLYNILLSKFFQQNNDLNELLKAENALTLNTLNINLDNFRQLIIDLLVKIRVSIFDGNFRGYNGMRIGTSTGYMDIGLDFTQFAKYDPLLIKTTIFKQLVQANGMLLNIITIINPDKYFILYTQRGIINQFQQGLLLNTKYLVEGRIWSNASQEGIIAIVFN
jgi:hypothetical protein